MMGTLLLSLLLSAPAPAPPEEPECFDREWLERLWPAPSAVSFTPTTEQEKAAVRALLPGLLLLAGRGEPLPPEVVSRAAEVELLLEERRSGGGRFWVLRERRSALRGAGAYVLRVGPASDDFVQAPHAYFDRGTGELGLRMFLCAKGDSAPRLFATNTAHRFLGARSRPKAKRARAADVAHNPDHLFQEVTRVALEQLAAPRIIQVHGFSARSELEEGPRAVVSAGCADGHPELGPLAARLRARVGQVQVFPSDTRELGGTTNVQGRLVHRHPRARFVHLELGPELRRSKHRARWAQELAEALFGEEGS